MGLPANPQVTYNALLRSAGSNNQKRKAAHLQSAGPIFMATFLSILPPETGPPFININKCSSPPVCGPDLHGHLLVNDCRVQLVVRLAHRHLQ